MTQPTLFDDRPKTIPSAREIRNAQRDNVLRHLQSGQSITPLEALNLYGCFRLAAIIHVLRKEGCPIVTEEHLTANHKRVARYYLK